MRGSKAGTIIKLPDGRIGTTVYNGLDGVGIKWGRHLIKEGDLCGYGGLFDADKAPEGYIFFPDAMLRNPYPSANLPCVGEDFEIEEQEKENE